MQKNRMIQDESVKMDTKNDRMIMVGYGRRWYIMLNLAKGYKISVPEKLNEGYEITSDVLNP